MTSVQTEDFAELSETVQIARDLIRIDTQNWGEGKANPERPAAEYVADYLTTLGVKSKMYESAPGRTTLIARIAGNRPELPALVLHGHLDVVPAQAEDWTVDPFAGEIRDGMLWGRGAVDMKDMDAMMLTAIAELLRSGERPNRDVILAFFADEENGSVYGSDWMVKHHPEVFDGAGSALSEVGGYSVYFGDQRAYLLQTGEKSFDWVRLRAQGTAGHGSGLGENNPVVMLSEAVAKLGAYTWPIELGDTTGPLLERVSELTGEGSPEELMSRAGTGAGFLKSSLRTTVNPTMLNAGYKHNVIPGTAEAMVDIRALPGKQDEVLKQVQSLIGENVEMVPAVSGIGIETGFSGDLVDTVIEVLAEHDPGAPVLPYLLSAGTDNKALSRLGIQGYGFVPLKLPQDLDFPSMFHGVDERVPLEAIDFGHRVLVSFLRRY